MKRSASAVWTGGLTDGSGTLTADSGVLSDTPYSFRTRFESEKGTNPEELIGAAHAGCYSMALSMILAEAGGTPKRIETRADVSLEKVDGGFAITKIHLVSEAEVDGLDDDAVRKAMQDAKAGCPVSKVLNAEITLDAKRAG